MSTRFDLLGCGSSMEGSTVMLMAASFLEVQIPLFFSPDFRLQKTT
jgi:hypothetical protein